MANPTFTYTPGTGSARDRMRLMIPDRPRAGVTNRPPAMFSDQELSELYNEYGDVQMAVAGACEIVAMDEAKRQLSFSVSSGMSLSRSGATFWLQRAKSIREEVRTNSAPWEFIDSVAIDIDRFGQDNSRYIGDEEE